MNITPQVCRGEDSTVVGDFDMSLTLWGTGGYVGMAADSAPAGVGRDADSAPAGVGRDADSAPTGVGRDADSAPTDVGRDADSAPTVVGRDADSVPTGFEQNQGTAHVNDRVETF